MCGCIGGTCVQYDKGAKGKRYSADKKTVRREIRALPLTHLTLTYGAYISVRAYSKRLRELPCVCRCAVRYGATNRDPGKHHWCESAPVQAQCTSVGKKQIQHTFFSPLHYYMTLVQGCGVYVVLFTSTISIYISILCLCGERVRCGL